MPSIKLSSLRLKPTTATLKVPDSTEGNSEYSATEIDITEVYYTSKQNTLNGERLGLVYSCHIPVRVLPNDPLSVGGASVIDLLQTGVLYEITINGLTYDIENIEFKNQSYFEDFYRLELKLPNDDSATYV